MRVQQFSSTRKATKNDGIYEPDFYDIVDEERYSYDDSGLTTLYFVATNGYYMLISDNGELRRVLATYLYTMTHLSIETDGNGDSAFVECAGQVWFYGINGYEIG